MDPETPPALYSGHHFAEVLPVTPVVPPWFYPAGEPIPKVTPCARCGGTGKDTEFVATACLLCGGTGRDDTKRPPKGFIGWVRILRDGRRQWWPATEIVSHTQAEKALRRVSIANEDGGRIILPSGVHPDPLNP